MPDKTKQQKAKMETNKETVIIDGKPFIIVDGDPFTTVTIDGEPFINVVVDGDPVDVTTIMVDGTPVIIKDGSRHDRYAIERIAGIEPVAYEIVDNGDGTKTWVGRGEPGWPYPYSTIIIIENEDNEDATTRIFSHSTIVATLSGLFSGGRNIEEEIRKQVDLLDKMFRTSPDSEAKVMLHRKRLSERFIKNNSRSIKVIETVYEADSSVTSEYKLIENEDGSVTLMKMREQLERRELSPG